MGAVLLQETSAPGSARDVLGLPEGLVIHPQKTIAFRGNNMKFRDMPVPNKVLPYGLLKMLWEYGFNPDELSDMFGCLPPRLEKVVWQTFMAAEKMISALATAKPPTDFKHDNGEFRDEVVQAWERSHRVAICSFGYDHTNLKRTAWFANKVMGEVVGMHCEEISGRMGDKTMPFSSTQLGSFCTVMDDMINFGQTKVLRYMVWKQVGGHRSGITLLRQNFEREFDAMGRCIRVVLYMVPSPPMSLTRRSACVPKASCPSTGRWGTCGRGTTFCAG